MAANMNVDSDSDAGEFSCSSSSSSEEEFTAMVSASVPLPYQQEPILNNEPADNDAADTTGAVGDVQTERIGNTDWCHCGKCHAMDTGIECICCQEVDPAVERMNQEGKPCVTDLDGFVANCLNIDVLEASFYEFLAVEHGPLGEDEEIHKIYRHVAYRRFTRFIWKLLGKGRRKVIPASAVTTIRTQFPSENYTSFKYPRP